VVVVIGINQSQSNMRRIFYWLVNSCDLQSLTVIINRKLRLRNCRIGLIRFTTSIVYFMYLRLYIHTKDNRNDNKLNKDAFERTELKLEHATARYVENKVLPKTCSTENKGECKQKSIVSLCSSLLHFLEMWVDANLRGDATGERTRWNMRRV